MRQLAGPGNGFSRPGQRLIRKAKHPQTDALLGSCAHAGVVAAIDEGVREVFWPIEEETLVGVLAHRPPLTERVLRRPIDVVGLQQQGRVARLPGDPDQLISEGAGRVHPPPGPVAGAQAAQRGEGFGRLAAQFGT